MQNYGTYIGLSMARAGSTFAWFGYFFCWQVLGSFWLRYGNAYSTEWISYAHCTCSSLKEI